MVLSLLERSWGYGAGVQLREDMERGKKRMVTRPIRFGHRQITDFNRLSGIPRSSQLCDRGKKHKKVT